MFRSMIAGMTLVIALAGSAAASQDAEDPLLRPIAADHAARWLKPQAPIRVFGNAYLVGFGGLIPNLVSPDS